MPGKTSAENGKLGGRPKGSKSQATLLREDAEAKYRQKWMDRFDELMEAQLSTAVGVKQFVYRDDAGRYKVIDDELELRARLNLGEAVEIVTRLANPQAQIDVLNRLMGKPQEPPQQLEVKGTINVVDVLKQRQAKRKKEAEK